MIVALISPRFRQGLTTSSLLIAQALAAGTKLNVVLSYTGDDYKSLAEYTGLDTSNDRTRSSSQLIKLIETGSLRANELIDYAVKVSSNMHILNTSSETTSIEDSEGLLRYFIQDSSDSGMLKIIEINTELDEQITQDVLTVADLVVVVADQTQKTAELYRKWKDSKEIAPDKHKTCLVVSRFDEMIMSSRDVARMYGIPYKRVSRISYNPQLPKFANEQRITDVIQYILNKNHHVYRLNADLMDCSKLIGNNLGFRIDWGD